VLASTVSTHHDLLADRDPHLCRDLFRAQEIFMRGMLEVLAFERDQALVAARLRALVDRHRQMTIAQELPWTILASRHGRRHALLVKAGTTTHASRCAKIDDQHAHRPVGLGLQDEAPSNLSTEPSITVSDGFAQRAPRAWAWLRRTASTSGPPHHAAARRCLHRKRQDVSSTEVAAGSRTGIPVSGSTLALWTRGRFASRRACMRN
jgi:hypothetical protein